MQNIILHVIVTKIVNSLDYITESYKIYFDQLTENRRTLRPFLTVVTVALLVISFLMEHMHSVLSNIHKLNSFSHANCFLHKKQRWELWHLFPITKLSILIFRVQLAHFPASKAHFPIFSAGSHAHFLAYPLGCDAHFSLFSSGHVAHFPSFPSGINGHLQPFPSGFNTFFNSDWPLAHFPAFPSDLPLCYCCGQWIGSCGYL